MRFGVHIGPQNTSVDELRRLWTFADQNGFSWVSVWDHLYCRTDSAAPHLETVALMGAMACDTRNVRIGCLVFCVAFRNPGMLAKSMVTIDHLSGGRADIGLGAGWHEPEFRAYGFPFLPPRQRLDMLEEHAVAIKGLLTQETTDVAGEYVRLESAYANPKPVQGRMPLWIGGNGEKRTLRLAARFADGWNGPYIGPDVFRHKAQVLDRWCEVEGRNPAEIDRTTNLGFYMAPDQRGVAAAEEKMREQLQDETEMRRPGQLTGTPAEVVERIGAYQQAGASQVNIVIRPPVDWDALHAFVEQVMPAFAS